MPNISLSRDTYDIVFAGGGTTACIIAGRLTRASPTLTILVLEAGPHTKNNERHFLPGHLLTHIGPGSKTTALHASAPSEALGGRRLFVHTGQCYGGGSAVNFMMYNRPSMSDYDDWEIEYANPGWGSKDLVPLLCKAETYEVNYGLPTHGYSGPLKVSLGGHYDVSAEQFINIGPQVENGRPSNIECNAMGPESLNVFARVPKWIDRKTGRRQDTAHNYIYNVTESENIELIAGCRVSRVLLEDNKAVGVEFYNDKNLSENSDRAMTPMTVRASRMVIISAGAMGSPAVLERSGIGSFERLRELGISQIVIDLPGVGENYQDHMLLSPSYFTDDAIVETFDEFLRGNPDSDANKGNRLLWKKTGAGILGSNGVDAAIKMRPRDDELHELGPDFGPRWKEFFEKKPDKPIVWMKGSPRLPGSDLASRLGLPPTKFLSGSYFVAYPECRGSVHITSADIYAPLNFDSGFMTKLSDLAILRWAYKHSREIMRRLPVFRGAVPQDHPSFPNNSHAITTEEVSPVDISAPRIVYTEEDDAAIDEFHRRTVLTTFHSLGTCAMKPRKDGGVVDSLLNVYGIENLKVADLSIAPSNVNANTYSTAIAIGEKAALIIANDLGVNIA